MYERGASQISSQEFFLRKPKLSSVFTTEVCRPESVWDGNAKRRHSAQLWVFDWLMFIFNYLFTRLRHTHTKNGFLNITVYVKKYHISTQTEEKSER